MRSRNNLRLGAPEAAEPPFAGRARPPGAPPRPVRTETDATAWRPYLPPGLTLFIQSLRGKSLIGRYRRVALLLLLASASAASAQTNGLPVLELRPADRVLVLAPHPDDEVIACGGVLQQAVAMKLPVRVVYLTHGDNNEWSFMVYRKRFVLFPRSVRRMGEVRREEALAAGAVLGLQPWQMVFLGYPDFGTLQIWRGYWDVRPPYRSMLTRARAVPYPTARRPGAPYKGEEILRDITEILRAFRPTKVFVPHPMDYNPDHRALYLFTRVALWDLEKRIQPELWPYLVHYPGWPRPRGYRPDAWLSPPSQLTNAVPWQTFPLTIGQVERKQAALQAHRSQVKSNRGYLESFVRANELFGDLPVLRVGDNAALSLADLNLARAEHEPFLPAELTARERARFVGVEWRYLRVEGKELVIALHFSKPLAEDVEASVYVFGYRRDYPFAQMPKLHLRMGATGSALYDQARKLPRQTARIERDADNIIIHIPLKTLGNPHRLLTSARTHIEDLPLDWVSWRILELAKPNP